MDAVKTKSARFSDLLESTLRTVTVNDDKTEMLFVTDRGLTFRMCGDIGACCDQDIHLSEITGDLSDLIDSPLIQVEECVSKDCGGPEGFKANNWDSFTWTFYRMATQKGQVVLRWYGTSNGYYSERVDFEQLL